MYSCNLIPNDVLTTWNMRQMQYRINITWNKTKYIRWAVYIADVAMLEENKKNEKIYLNTLF